jgi:Patched family
MVEVIVLDHPVGGDGDNNINNKYGVDCDDDDNDNGQELVFVVHDHDDHDSESSPDFVVLQWPEPAEATPTVTTKTNAEEANHHHDDDDDGFLGRQARRMAHYPKLHFWISLLVTIVMSGVTFLVCEEPINVDTTPEGWLTRGTTIAKRQAQNLIMISNAQRLRLNISSIGDASNEQVWIELTGQSISAEEEEEEEDVVSSSFSSSAAMKELEETLLVQQRVENNDSSGSNSSNEDWTNTTTATVASSSSTTQTSLSSLTLLQNQLDFLTEYGSKCDISFYTSVSKSRLWPVWTSTNVDTSLFGRDQMYQMCVSEETTVQVLESNGLCDGCNFDPTICLPPLSVVLLARLTVPNGLKLSCMELSDEWMLYKSSMELQLKDCIRDIKAAEPSSVSSFLFDSSSGSQSTTTSAATATKAVSFLPKSCPIGFSPHMVDVSFEQTGILQYTSALYMTNRSMLHRVYDVQEEFGRGGANGTVIAATAAYDTQNQNFVQYYQVDAIFTNDMPYTFGSAVFVVVAIMIHTRSILVTVVGLVQIILSIPLAYFFYTFAFGYRSFPILNFIGAFVVFAIGADDVFVAVDKWKNARLDDPTASTPDIAAKALPDAAKAMLLTTLTTAFAFFSTAICPVVPIKLFGIFVGILVMAVYILCILLVFPCLCIYDISQQAKFFASSSPQSSDSKFRKPKQCCFSRRRCDRVEAKPPSVESTADEKSSFIRRLMSRYHQTMYHYRYWFLLTCIVAIALSIYGTTLLQPAMSLDVRMLDESNEFEQSHQWRQQILYFDILRSAGGVSYIYWGLQPVDTGDHSKFGVVSCI